MDKNPRATPGAPWLPPSMSCLGSSSHRPLPQVSIFLISFHEKYFFLQCSFPISFLKKHVSTLSFTMLRALQEKRASQVRHSYKANCNSYQPEKYKYKYRLNTNTNTNTDQIQILKSQATLKSLIKFLTDQEKEAGFAHSGFHIMALVFLCHDVGCHFCHYVVSFLSP